MELLDTDLLVSVSVGLLRLRSTLSGLVLRGHIKQGGLALLYLASTCQTLWKTLLQEGLVFEARARLVLFHLPPVDIHLHRSRLQFERPFADALYLRNRVSTLTMGLCVLAPEMRPGLSRVRSVESLRKMVAKVGNSEGKGGQLALTAYVSHMTATGISESTVFGFRTGSPIRPKVLIERPRAPGVHEVMRLDTDPTVPVLERMRVAKAPHRVLKMYPNSYNATNCAVLMVAGENTDGLSATLNIWNLDKPDAFDEVPLCTNFVIDGLVFPQHIIWTSETTFDVWWSSTLGIADFAVGLFSDIYRFAFASYMIGKEIELVTTGREMEHYTLLKVLPYAHNAASMIIPVLTAQPIGMSQNLQFYETDEASSRWKLIISSMQLIDAAVNSRADMVFALYHGQGCEIEVSVRTGRHLLKSHVIKLEERVTSLELVMDTTLLVRQRTNLVAIVDNPALPKPSVKTCRLDRMLLSANMAVVQAPNALLMLTAV